MLVLNRFVELVSGDDTPFADLALALELLADLTLEERVSFHL